MNISILFLNVLSRDVVLNYDFIINDLFDGYEKEIYFLNNNEIKEQNFDVLIYNCRNPRELTHFGYAPPYEIVFDVVQKVNPKIIIQMSDEFWEEQNNIHNELSKHCNLFIRQYSHWNQNYSNKIIQKPLGYLNDYPINLENIKPIVNRKYFWSWVGHLKGERQYMINCFMRIWNHICACNGGLDRKEIYELYSNSMFVPIGRGNSSIDCWRIYEAIVCGAIPVIVSYTDEINWAFQYKEKLPALFADSWEDAVNKCIYLSENVGELTLMQSNLLNWWKKTVFFIQNEIKAGLSSKNE